MKRRKHRKNSSRTAGSAKISAETTQAVLAYDIARYSAETVYYSIAMMQRAVTAPIDPEILASTVAKLLAAGEAAVMAVRQTGPIQRSWTGAWFQHLSALQQAWRQEHVSYEVGRAFADAAKSWLKADGVADAATLAQMKPGHRTTKRNARRPEHVRVH